MTYLLTATQAVWFVVGRLFVCFSKLSILINSNYSRERDLCFPLESGHSVVLPSSSFQGRVILIS